jgi:hypothetical protein
MLGHPELITPENKSEFEAMTEYLRKHHVAMKHQDAVIATDFRHGLAPIIGKMGAYRVARQITRAASLNVETGLAYVRAFDLYEELYENRVKVNMKFDPTR